jgi:hypothetical protein
MNCFRRFTALSRVVVFATAALTAQTAPQANTFDIKQAFEIGRVELTFTGKQLGEMIDIKITNVSRENLIVTIKKGTTTFVFPSKTISLLSEVNKTVSLEPAKNTTITLRQSGYPRINSGSMTVRMQPQ